MTPHRPQPETIDDACWQTRTPRRLATLIAVSCVVATLAACGGTAAQVRLPAKLVAPKVVAVSSPAALTTRQQVIGAFIGYTNALARAEDSRSSTAASRLLRPYLAASRVDGLVKTMEAIWARGQSFLGRDLLHVSAVTVAGRHAFVHDCDNTSGMALVSIATGQIVPGSSGALHVNLITRLDLVSGHWLVQFQLVEDVPCAS